MERIIFSIIGMTILLAFAGYYYILVRKGAIIKGTGMAIGIAIGMITCIYIGILLSELGGFHDAASLSILYGAAVGFGIGIFLEKRSQKQ